MRDFGSIPYELISKENNIFPAGHTTGTCIAAIKCLLIMGVHCDFYSKEVSLSLGELEKHTGCSKPMIIKGIKYMIDVGIIRRLNQEKTNVKGKYVINFTSHRFTQIPYNISFDLAEFPNKGVVALVALKAYLVLLKFRKNQQNYTDISYKGFANYHINLRYLKRALAILITLGYIDIHKKNNVYSSGDYIQTCHHYRLHYFPITHFVNQNKL